MLKRSNDPLSVDLGSPDKETTFKQNATIIANKLNRSMQLEIQTLFFSPLIPQEEGKGRYGIRYANDGRRNVILEQVNYGESIIIQLTNWTVDSGQDR